jgi:hypothetical protein
MATKTNYLWIKGVLVKAPFSIKISRNKLWSDGSGRSLTGKWLGSIKARKYKLEVAWRQLSDSEADTLVSAIDSADYFTVKFVDPYSRGAYKEITCYAGDVDLEVYSYNDKYKTYKGINCSFVEQ